MVGTAKEQEHRCLVCGDRFLARPEVDRYVLLHFLEEATAAKTMSGSYSAGQADQLPKPTDAEMPEDLLEAEDKDLVTRFPASRMDVIAPPPGGRKLQEASMEEVEHRSKRQDPQPQGASDSTIEAQITPFGDALRPRNPGPRRRLLKPAGWPRRRHRQTS